MPSFRSPPFSESIDAGDHDLVGSLQVVHASGSAHDSHFSTPNPGSARLAYYKTEPRREGRPVTS